MNLALRSGTDNGEDGPWDHSSIEGQHQNKQFASHMLRGQAARLFKVSRSGVSEVEPFNANYVFSTCGMTCSCTWNLTDIIKISLTRYISVREFECHMPVQMLKCFGCRERHFAMGAEIGF